MCRQEKKKIVIYLLVLLIMPTWTSYAFHLYCNVISPPSTIQSLKRLTCTSQMFKLYFPNVWRVLLSCESRKDIAYFSYQYVPIAYTCTRICQPQGLLRLWTHVGTKRISCKVSWTKQDSDEHHGPCLPSHHTRCSSLAYYGSICTWK